MACLTFSSVDLGGSWISSGQRAAGSLGVGGASSGLGGASG